VFLHPVGSAGHTVHFGASGVRNIDKLFFMLGWALCGFQKGHARTRYAELIFSHPVGYAGHLVHSGASGPQNFDALFFILRWDRYEFHKKFVDALFFKLGWTGTDSIKSVTQHITSNLCFFIRWDLWVM
jgi:hypothetical protein